MTHGDDCNNEYTYKNNAKNFDALVSASIYLDKNETVYDALLEVLRNEGIGFTEENGYISEIGNYAEFGHGPRSGWMFTVSGEHKSTGCRETKLMDDCTVIWYYTDDYTKERGQDEYEDDSAEANTELKFGLPDKNDDITYKEIINKGKTFPDVVNCVGKSKIEILAERGIINGKTEESFDPYATMTRAEFATIVVNALGLPIKDGVRFEDVGEDSWYAPYIKTANYYGIVFGVSGNRFNPEGTITKEEAASMVSRASNLCGIKTEINVLEAKSVLEKFDDYNDISSWAFSSMGFCVKEGILDAEQSNISPKEEVNREMIAVMIYNMLGKAELL